VTGEEGAGKSTIIRALLPHTLHGARIDAEDIGQTIPARWMTSSSTCFAVTSPALWTDSGPPVTSTSSPAAFYATTRTDHGAHFADSAAESGVEGGVAEPSGAVDDGVAHRRPAVTWHRHAVAASDLPGGSKATGAGTNGLSGRVGRTTTGSGADFMSANA